MISICALQLRLQYRARTALGSLQGIQYYATGEKSRGRPLAGSGSGWVPRIRWWVSQPFLSRHHAGNSTRSGLHNALPKVASAVVQSSLILLGKNYSKVRCRVTRSAGELFPPHRHIERKTRKRKRQHCAEQRQPLETRLYLVDSSSIHRVWDERVDTLPRRCFRSVGETAPEW